MIGHLSCLFLTLILGAVVAVAVLVAYVWYEEINHGGWDE